MKRKNTEEDIEDENIKDIDITKKQKINIDINHVKNEILSWFGGIESCNKLFTAKDKNNKIEYIGLECMKDDNGNIVDIDVIDNKGERMISTYPDLKTDPVPLIKHFQNLLPPPVPINLEQNKFETPITDISSLKKTKFDVIQFTENILDNVEDIFNTFNESLKIYEVYEETPIKTNTNIILPEITFDKPTTLYSFINNFSEDIQKKIHAVILCFSLIRSYIDFYHDYEHLAYKNLNYIKTLLAKSKIFNDIKDIVAFDGISVSNYLSQNLDFIDKQAVTSSGNVNQTTCKKLCKFFMEKYCQVMISYGVYWLTPNKETALICSAKTFIDTDENGNPIPNKEIDALIDNLTEDGIQTFYTETDKSHISEIFLENGFNMIVSHSGKRDAGSGFSEKTALNKNKNVKFINIYREHVNTDIDITNRIIKNDRKYTILNNDLHLPSQYLFIDLFNIALDNDEKKNNLILINIDESKVTLNSFKNNDVERLSINAVLETVGMPQLRGEGNASPLQHKKIENNSDTCKVGILSLKTFTDFIQLLDVYDVKDSGIRSIFITLDMLCEDSAMIFGLPTIRSESGFASYYCYDTRYHIINPEYLERKKNIFLRIVSNHELLIKQIKQNIFNPIKSYLESISKFHFNPAIYYGSNFLLNEIIEIELSAMKKINDVVEKYIFFKTNNNNIADINYLKLFPLDNDSYSVWAAELFKKNIDPKTKLNEFNGDFDLYMEQICEFSRIKGTFINTSNLFMEKFNFIRNIENRTQPDEFKKIYYNIKQELINFLPKNASFNEINFNIMLIFIVAFSTKVPHAQKSMIFVLNQFLEDDTIDNTDKELVNNILSNTDYIKELFNVIHKISETDETISKYLDTFDAAVSGNIITEIFKPIPYALIYRFLYNKMYGNIFKFGEEKVDNQIISYFKTGGTLKPKSKKHINKPKNKSRKSKPISKKDHK